MPKWLTPDSASILRPAPNQPNGKAANSTRLDSSRREVGRNPERGRCRNKLLQRTVWAPTSKTCELWALGSFSQGTAAEGTPGCGGSSNFRSNSTLSGLVETRRSSSTYEIGAPGCVNAHPNAELKPPDTRDQFRRVVELELVGLGRQSPLWAQHTDQSWQARNPGSQVSRLSRTFASAETAVSTKPTLTPL